MLNDATYGPANGPHWAMNRSRYPNLIRVLAKEPDPEMRMDIMKSHGRIVDRARGSTRYRNEIRKRDDVSYTRQ